VIKQYFEAEVLPHVPDAWVDTSKTKVGYEIPFTRHFYTYVPPRPLEEIDADLEKQVARILELLREVEQSQEKGYASGTALAMLHVKPSCPGTWRYRPG
jgi:hypothetical protein